MSEEVQACPPEDEQAAELTGRQALLYEIGSKLSQARATAGESIEEAVRKLKIRKSHLLALEHGDWDTMPDDIYVLGFLRQYSQYLGVDISDELQRLKHDQYALTKPLTFPDPPVAPSRRWAWVAGAAFVLLFTLFNIATENQHMDKPDSSAATVTAATDSTSSAPADDEHAAAGDTAPPAILPPPDNTQPPPSPTPNTLSHKAPVTAVTAAAADQTRVLVVKPATADKRAAPHHNANTTAAHTLTANITMHRFRFDAVGSPVWLQVSRPAQPGNGKGRLLKEVLLQPGFHTTIHARSESLWITCGNAPALRISVDGREFAAAGSLGTGKKVLRDYRFSIGHDN